ncbi:hypothetical protein JXA56_04315 [Candidatus Micrarchaeota archaeon]|nr:hypothetical protein [Candidatus Micrarchaeota archaeon]
MGGISTIGFRKADFEREVTDVLREGVQEMSLYAKNPEAFMDACNRMDCRIGEIVQRHRAPANDVSKLKERVGEIIQSAIRAYDVDLAPYLEKQVRKASCQILNALGKQISLEDPMNSCLHMLQCNGLTYEQATTAITEFSEHRGTTTEIIGKIGYRDEFRPFLRLLEEKGIPRVSQAAREELHSVFSQPTAKLLRLSEKKQNAIPLRQARH